MALLGARFVHNASQCSSRVRAGIRYTDYGVPLQVCVHHAVARCPLRGWLVENSSDRTKQRATAVRVKLRRRCQKPSPAPVCLVKQSKVRDERDGREMLLRLAGACRALDRYTRYSSCAWTGMYNTAHVQVETKASHRKSRRASSAPNAYITNLDSGTQDG